MTFQSQQFAKIAGNVATGQVDPHHRVLQGESLVDGHSMGYSVTRIQHHSCGSTGGVARDGEGVKELRGLRSKEGGGARREGRLGG